MILFPIVISIVLLLPMRINLQKSQGEVLLPQNSEPSETETLSLIQNNSLIGFNAPYFEGESVKKLKMVITAYSSSPQQTDSTPFITAAGTYVREGIVANNMLPFGTKVKIPEIYGNKVFVVEDRMHPRKGYYHLDVWFPSYQQAAYFGAKITYVEVLES